MRLSFGGGCSLAAATGASALLKSGRGVGRDCKETGEGEQTLAPPGRYVMAGSSHMRCKSKYTATSLPPQCTCRPNPSLPLQPSQYCFLWPHHPATLCCPATPMPPFVAPPPQCHSLILRTPLAPLHTLPEKRHSLEPGLGCILVPRFKRQSLPLSAAINPIPAGMALAKADLALPVTTENDRGSRQGQRGPWQGLQGQALRRGRGQKPILLSK